MKLIFPISMVLSAIAIEAPGALADYTLELKNGRRITVQSYREDLGMIKFNGLGGEIGLSKDQILSIRPTSAADASSLNVQQRETSAPRTSVPVPRTSGLETERPLAADEDKAREEKEYQNKLRDLTNQLKGARDQYSQAIRGTTGSDPTVLVTEEQIKARESDASSRFKNALHNPSEPAPVRLLVPSPFTTLPPTVATVSPAPFPPAVAGAPNYTNKEKELTDMRERTNRIEQERERLLSEMRQKNLNTGSLVLE